jgi:hypothetical protein
MLVCVYIIFMVHPIETSLRFFPHWSPDDALQVIGFMEMVSRILESGPVNRWIEVGGGFGESVTLLLGYPGIERVDVVEHLSDRVEYMARRFRGFRCHVHKAGSPSAASLFDDGCADVVYIDASHDYESVLGDIAAWRPKSRRFVCGHDLTSAWPGVERAVKESFGNFEVFRDNSWLASIS